MDKKNIKDTKTFDAIKVLRPIRHELSLEILNMSKDDERGFLKKLQTEANGKYNN